MEQHFTIYGQLAGANEYIDVCRRNRFGAARFKRQQEEAVWLAIKQAELKPQDTPTRISIEWYEPTARRDPDNIRFGVKFILDALVRAEVLPDDRQKYISGISDTFAVDKDNPRVEIILRSDNG